MLWLIILTMSAAIWIVGHQVIEDVPSAYIPKYFGWEPAAANLFMNLLGLLFGYWWLFFLAGLYWSVAWLLKMMYEAYWKFKEDMVSYFYLQNVWLWPIALAYKAFEPREPLVEDYAVYSAINGVIGKEPLDVFWPFTMVWNDFVGVLRLIGMACFLVFAVPTMAIVVVVVTYLIDTITPPKPEGSNPSAAP